MTRRTDRSDAHVAAIVQARMSSSRLPGKVLEDLGGQPALVRVLDRLGKAHELDEVVVATSVDPSDDPIVELVASRGIAVERGSLADVLERYRSAAVAHPSAAVARITADCPLIDPEIVDAVVARWREGAADYVSNTLEPRTFPKGLDVEVMTTAVLMTAAQEATDPYDREHVTPFIRSRPERFAQDAVYHDPPYGDVRVTLDTPDDLVILRGVYESVGPAPSLPELLAALDAQPDEAR